MGSEVAADSNLPLGVRDEVPAYVEDERPERHSIARDEECRRNDRQTYRLIMTAVMAVELAWIAIVSGLAYWFWTLV